MKYPNIIFFRYNEYSYIDTFLESNKNNLDCTINIISEKNDLNKLFDPNYVLLITFGDANKYLVDVNSIIPDRIRKRWIHYDKIDDINNFNRGITYCFIDCAHKTNRVTFSLFTTCYNSYDKIIRAYDSIKNQTFKDFEWVILDDSPDDDHFNFLRKIFNNDKRIRLYKRSENSGIIGNVKNEAVLLCRGKYVLEMDHDDEILPDVLKDSVEVFESDEDVGFIYMDYSNIYENKDNFNYGNFFGLGYSGYYCTKYNNRWIYVASTPNVNNITLSNIVSIPNHPRIWRKEALLKIDNFCEFLPIADDYELFIKTALKTKIVKIHKLGYIQYMNNNNNNFSLIRNSEITRLTTNHIFPQYYAYYNINNEMKKMNGYEDEKYISNHSQIWKRTNYEHSYCNKIVNINHKKQYCIIGYKTLTTNLDGIKNLYLNLDNDFIVLDNVLEINQLTDLIDSLNFDRMKCYSMKDCTYQELEKYFELIYKSCSDFGILKENIENLENIENIENLENIENKKKITIITPSIRPENLQKIKDSINFDYVNEWIIVYDKNKIKENPMLFSSTEETKIKEYMYSDTNSISGNAQRNFAIDNMLYKDTYLYFLDDDNIIHPDLYKLLNKLENNKMYTFDQKRPIDIFPYKELLKGDTIELNNIDTAMFLIDYNLCKDIRWQNDKYNADGYYILDCYNNNKNNWIYVNELLSFYNQVRESNPAMCDSVSHARL